jgi:Uncharacterized protein conserved in bacteria (DUF2188)
MAKDEVHVTWREDEAKWAVEKEGTSRAASLHDQKDSAEKSGQAAINELTNWSSTVRTARSRSAYAQARSLPTGRLEAPWAPPADEL